jgi:type II secretory ATPase GspE/PulE/Tfp pilus assembly ATPase PilB-like protein
MDSHLSLADQLIERRLLSSEEMERVAKLQQEQQAPLIRLIVELGFLSEDDLLPVLRDHFEIPMVALKDFPATPLPLEFSPTVGDFFKQARMVPIKIDGRSLLVAITDPLDIARLHALELAAGLHVKPVLAKEKDITARIEALFGNSYSTEANTASAAREIEGAVDEEDVAHLRDMASEVPVIRLVNQMLVRALESRASDVHIEPFENHLKVRYRIDGILHEVEPPPRQLKAAVISRLKILAQLNIAERRLPQDGRIKVRLAGKATTLYGALQKINDPGKKIITIEDPVEYQLSGVNQIQVKPQIGLSFANGLRSIVRQDPDVIMVGEIRDAETAEIAVQAALTGHLVFSTLHTNDAAGAISRLLEMGVQDYLLSSSLLGVLAQRLVRRLCANCRQQVPFAGFDGNEPELTLQSPDRLETVWDAVGCDQCSGTGYLGRVGIFELLPVTSEICKVIVQRADAGMIRSLAVQQGMRLLREDGWDKVRQGVTTVAEVLRVTREEA